MCEKISQKKLQKSDKKVLQFGDKRVTIWLQQGTNPATVKSFSSCFWDIGRRLPLLRLFSFSAVRPAPHRRYPASCAKKSVFRDGLFCLCAALRHTLGGTPFLPAGCRGCADKRRRISCRPFMRGLCKVTVFCERILEKFVARRFCILAPNVVLL